MPDTVSVDLILEAQKGNPDAVGALYESYHQRVYQYLYYRTADPKLAEDLTGDVFLRMVEKLSRFQGDDRALFAWLLQIARNLTIDHYRRKNILQFVKSDESQCSIEDPPDEITEKHLNCQVLHNALSTLTDDQRDVIVMRFVVGMPLSEVAKTLRRSEDAIKGLQRRGLIALREKLIVLRGVL